MKAHIVDMVLVFAAVMSVASVGNASRAKAHGHKKIVYVAFSETGDRHREPTADELKEIQALENLAARHSDTTEYRPVE